MSGELENSAASALLAGQIVLSDRVLKNGAVLLSGGKILQVGEKEQVKIPNGAVVTDFGSQTIAPGMIDVHTHGCKGAWAGESLAGTIAIADYVVHQGVTSYLPTVHFAPSVEGMCRLLEVTAEAVRTPKKGAQMLGINFEAPFFTRAPKGPWDRYHPAGMTGGAMARDPSVAELRQYAQAAGGLIRLMTIAPELDGALDVIAEMRSLGIIPSIGHTAASYEQTVAGIKAGALHATHLYNAMRRMDHREPGVIEACLTHDEITAELIGDCIHVYPPALDLAIRSKGIDRVILITDNTSFAGIPNGEYPDESGRFIVKDDEKAYIPGYSLAGSISPMNRDVNNLVQQVGRTLPEAFKMAALNPARLLGVDRSKGSLEAGKDADLIVIDEQINIQAVMIQGNWVS